MQNDTQQPINTNQPEANTQPMAPQPTSTEPTAPHPFAPQNLDEPPKRKKPIGKIILIVFGVLLLIGAGVAIGWFVFKDKQEQQKAVQQTEDVVKTVETVTKEEVDAALAKFITPTTGEIWLDQPKQLPDQKFHNAKDYPDNNITYYEVGKRGENTIIMSVATEMGDVIRLYEKTPSGKVSLIVQPDPDFIYNPEETYVQDSLAPGVAIDTATRYDSLTIPKAIKLENGYYVTKSEYPYLGDFIRPGDSDSKVTTIKEYGGSTLTMHEKTNQETNLTSISYRMVTPVNTRIKLDYTPLEKKLQNYTWTQGASGIQDELVAISYGCGGLYTSVTKIESAKDSDFVVVGKSQTGKEVYHAKDTNNPIVTKAYDEFVEFYSYDPANANAKMTKEEFINQHGVVFFKDANGQWLVYSRGQLRPGGGCAKPVVYLYPQAATDFTVKVGADVKISIPNYDSSKGWQGTARPDGSLTVAGAQYDSLFWEGPGYGEYPAISSGTIVPTSTAVGVIRTQLQELGLTEKESADFLAYWSDKMPNKPFTRLTWLTTSQLNELAPLAITPKPDTLIRVFLDYSGLDAPINLPEQELQTIPRNGFTVVEWGGLSPYKLY